MVGTNLFNNRRRELRFRNDDVVRWKRPGRVEDHKAWMVDRSPGGLGFYVMESEAPQVGEHLNVRRWTGDTWMPFEGVVRVARVCSDSNALAIVGCTIE